MSFNGSDVGKLQLEMAMAVVDQNRLEQFMMIRLNQPLNQILSPNDNLRDACFAVIQWAQAQGRELDLLRSLEDHFPSRMTLKALCAVLRVALAATGLAGADPYAVCFARARVPFVNRTKLRNALKELRAGDIKVLVITGSSRRIGMSYSLEMINWLRQRPGGFRPVLVSLNEGSGAYSPVDVTKSFLRQLGRDAQIDRIPKRRTEDNEQAWVTEVVDFLIGETIQVSGAPVGDQVWLVLDGATHAVKIPREFIQSLAIKANMGSSGLRVVLIDYENLIPEIERTIVREKILVVTNDDIDNFYTSFAATVGRPIPQNELDKSIARSKDTLQLGGPNVMDDLNGLLIEETNRLKQLVNGG